MIVMNENAWAEEKIKAQTLGDKPYETFVRVARYYLDQGYKKSEVRKKLDEFVISCDPYISIPKWSNTLDKAVSKASKYAAVQIDHIDVTRPELEKIAELSGVMARRLAFVLLVLSKYWNTARDTQYWVNNEDGEIMKMANIKTSIKKQCSLFKQLHDAGLIRFSKKVDNTNVQVLFAQDGDVAMEITDLRNLGFQYLAHIDNKGFYQCQNCGLLCKLPNPNRHTRGGSNPKYCTDCAAKIRIRQNVDSVMRIRERINSLQSS